MRIGASTAAALVTDMSPLVVTNPGFEQGTTGWSFTQGTGG
ncbi:hypothetical protein ACIBIZ_52710 [Nonomuraea spiralis]|nr:hypothetical protein [Nonomuraea sp. WAC 01424]